jgi:hypothetical protein
MAMGERLDHARTFTELVERGAALREGSFAVGGRRLAVRCVGEAHWADLSSSLLPASAGAADFRLDLWDPCELGLPRGRAYDTRDVADDLEHPTALFSPDGRMSYASGASDLVYDRAATTGCGWIEAERLPPWERLRPWQELFAAVLPDFGLETFHAAVVSNGERGVLLAGQSGAGKSTVCTAWLDAGNAFLGDDAVAVEQLDGPVGHTLHAVCKLSVEGMAAFPALARLGERYVDPLGEELALRLANSGIVRVDASARIEAIAFPQTAPSAASSVKALPPGVSARQLLPHALSMTRGRMAHGFEAAAQLAEQTPAFLLEVGRDPRGIVAAVEQMLEAAERPAARAALIHER